MVLCAQQLVVTFVLVVTFSEFPTEADLEDFTEATADGADDGGGGGGGGRRDYYYDTFKGDDYNEESPPTNSYRAAGGGRSLLDVRGRPGSHYLHYVNILSFTYRLLASPGGAASCPKVRSALGATGSHATDRWSQETVMCIEDLENQRDHVVCPPAS